MMFNKILIANRGEVALRVMRAAKELGVKTVAVYSTEDADTYPVRYADEAVCIGPAQANKSYLVMANIIAAAKNTGAEAIHPGYGFLAENADFARACADNDLVFIGPSAECIERMGDKSAARETMKGCGVPTVPGSDGCIDTAAEAKAFADSVGYPVLIKATAGGGGKGMREVHDPSELEAQYQAARTEAGAAFGNDGVYLEKLVLRPRHVEVQVLATTSATTSRCASATARCSAATRSSSRRRPRRRSTTNCAVRWAWRPSRRCAPWITATPAPSNFCSTSAATFTSWR